MLVELMRVLTIVQETKQMAFPISKLLSSILLKADVGINSRAFMHVLGPGGVDPLLTIDVGNPNGHDYSNEGQQTASDHHLLGEDESRRKEGETVDFVSEVDQKLAVVAQLSLAQRTAVLAGCSEVHEHDDQHHHGEVRHYHEETDAQHDGDKLRLEDDLTVDVLQAEGTLHRN
jgi:hypothetical protein